MANNFSGWWLSQPPLWKMMEFVSWDDDIPNIWKNKKCSNPPTSFFYIIVSICIRAGMMMDDGL